MSRKKEKKGEFFIMEEKTIITAEQARRIYMNEWKKKNRDKVKKHNETFWAKRAAKMMTEAESDKCKN